MQAKEGRNWIYNSDGTFHNLNYFDKVWIVKSEKDWCLMGSRSDSKVGSIMLTDNIDSKQHFINILNHHFDLQELMLKHVHELLDESK